MNNTKYIGMGVQRESNSIAVVNSTSRIVVESVFDTKVSTLLQFING